jgi:lipopolysaccharide transport protein LptA
MKAHLFNSKGVNSFVVEGQDGYVYGIKDMKLEGGVIITTSSGYRIQTQSAYYHSKEEVLESEDPIEMKSLNNKDNEFMNVNGVGFKGFVNDSNIDIQKDVVVRKGLKDARVINIKSQRARFSGTDKSANFSGEVVVDLGPSRITGPEARFESDEKSNELKSLEVDGGVKLSDVDKWATARRFKMLLLKDEFTLSGAPRLVQENDELRGEEIVFSEGGKKVKVRGAKASFDSDNKDSL